MRSLISLTMILDGMPHNVEAGPYTTKAGSGLAGNDDTLPTYDIRHKVCKLLIGNSYQENSSSGRPKAHKTF